MGQRRIFRQLGMAFTVTWLAWCSLIKNEIPALETVLFIIGGWGPTIAGLIEYQKRGNLKEKFRGGTVQLFLPLVVGTLCIPLLLAMNNLPQWKSPLEYLRIFLVMTFLKGGNEEILWRGSLYDDVKKWPFIKRTLFIGGVWALWHLPLFLIPKFERGGLTAFIPFVISCFFIHALLGRLRQKGNLWHPIIYHGLLNFVMTEFIIYLKP